MQYPPRLGTFPKLSANHPDLPRRPCQRHKVGNGQTLLRAAALRLCVGGVLLLCRQAGGAATEDSDSPIHESSIRINKDVTDPVSTTWSLKIKNRVTFVDVGSHGAHPQYTLEFQPTMPVWLLPDLKLITRPQFTLIEDTPFNNGADEVSRTTAVGDTILDEVIAPQMGPWLVGAGPTFTFPTANVDQTGKGKWQAGPAGVAGYRVHRWIAFLIAQQWWSFAGAPERPAVSELHLQYSASYFFGDGWSVGTAPTIKFNWRAASGDQVTFPIGPTLGKLVKIGSVLPVKLELEVLYMPVYPSHDGARCSVQFTLTPVIAVASM